MDHVCDSFRIADFQIDQPAANIILSLPGKIGYQAFFISYIHNETLLTRTSQTLKPWNR
jgi:hypothetical protein